MTHLVIDLQTFSPVLREKDGLCRYLIEAVQLANMELLAGPYLWQTGFDDPNPGITGFVAITTSHFALHTFTRQESAFIDLFSCKPFRVSEMLALTRRVFKPYFLDYSEVPRLEIRLRRRPDLRLSSRVHLNRKGVGNGSEVDQESHQAEGCFHPESPESWHGGAILCSSGDQQQEQILD